MQTFEDHSPESQANILSTSFYWGLSLTSLRQTPNLHTAETALALHCGVRSNLDASAALWTSERMGKSKEDMCRDTKTALGQEKKMATCHSRQHTYRLRKATKRHNPTSTTQPQFLRCHRGPGKTYRALRRCAMSHTRGAQQNPLSLTLCSFKGKCGD